MERRPHSDLGLIYAMLRQCGIHSIDLADLDAYEVVELTEDNGELFDWYPDHGTGLKLLFRRTWVADLADLAEARHSIEDAAHIEITLVREPDLCVPGRWIAVPLDRAYEAESRTRAEVA